MVAVVVAVAVTVTVALAVDPCFQQLVVTKMPRWSLVHNGYTIMAFLSNPCCIGHIMTIEVIGTTIVNTHKEDVSANYKKK